MKRCGRCGIEKPAAEYHRDRSRADGLHSYCRSCKASYHVANRPSALARMARRDIRQRDADRGRRLRVRYGVTAEDVDSIRKSQGYSCAICGTHEDNLPRGLHVDHDHVTNLVRGMLCQLCNSAIGLFSDSPVALRSAIAYLAMADELRAIADHESRGT